jgi:fatty acid-binding protein DegV
LLHLLPIICTKPGGRIGLAGFLFGSHNRIARFAKLIARRAPKNLSIEVGIGHAVCESDAKELEQEIRLRLPATKKLTVNGLGPGLGAHGGPGSLLVSIRPIASANDFTNAVD